MQYFCNIEHTPIERGSPRRSPRKNPPETDNSVGRGLSSLVSPGRGDADLPGQVGAQEDTDRGKEGQGGEDENGAGQRKGRKDTDQGDVCPTVEKNKTASPCRSQEKILQKLSYFKEHLTRIIIMAERFRAGWTTLLASRGKGWMTRAKGV